MKKLICVISALSLAHCASVKPESKPSVDKKRPPVAQKIKPSAPGAFVCALSDSWDIDIWANETCNFDKKVREIGGAVSGGSIGAGVFLGGSGSSFNFGSLNNIPKRFCCFAKQ